MKLPLLAIFFLFPDAGRTRKSFMKKLKQKKAHIVFILADDLGWNEVTSLSLNCLVQYLLSLNQQGLYFSYLRHLCSFQVSWHNPGFQTPAMEELSRKVLIVKQSSTKPLST